MIARLDTRIVLLMRHDSLVVGPASALLREGVDVRQLAVDLALALDEFHGKTTAGVPCNVAVDDPRTGIVLLKGHGDEAVAR